MRCIGHTVRVVKSVAPFKLIGLDGLRGGEFRGGRVGAAPGQPRQTMDGDGEGSLPLLPPATADEL